MKKVVKFFVMPIMAVVLGILIYNQLCIPIIPNKRALEALEFCKKNNLNTEYCVFVDFSKHPGKKRYVIYNLKERKIEHSSVCANGLNKNQFSNVEGSNLSSLGKYRVTPMVGKMRIGEECLILEGLESSNNNAKKRQILIHSYPDVYYNPGTYPFNFFWKNLSHGCFVIDKPVLKQTKKIAKPMLLWAYI